MCILFFAINKHPKYPVIICANRDEFHQRPTQAMHWWSESDKQTAILAGKDLQAGGSWLGLTKQGRFSALTNVRQPQLFDDSKKSRGELVLNAITNTDNQVIAQLETAPQTYNAFNLVFGHLTNLFCYDSTSHKYQSFTTGFHSLCNGTTGDIWPKMELGQRELADTINCADKNKLPIERLFTLMQNNQQAQTASLPKTGIPLDWEHLLSSIFITSLEYGTRTTNIITLDNQGMVNVYDKSYNERGESTNIQKFTLTL